MVLALRYLLGTHQPNFVAFSDDESFISVPHLFQLAATLPAERLYAGNVISTFQFKGQTLERPTRDVASYVTSASRAPLFAQGMGFLVSRDIAEMILKTGLQAEMFGPDDALLGMWLRSVEDLRIINLPERFVEHEGELGSAFARPCTGEAVIVHRMTPERWQRFDSTSVNPVIGSQGNPFMNLFGRL